MKLLAIVGILIIRHWHVSAAIRKASDHYPISADFNASDAHAEPSAGEPSE